MKYRHGNTVCVSSQAGCRMGCSFCASKPEGFSRDLSCGEMLGQVTAISRDISSQVVDNIVIMGVGEPFNNYDNCLKFIRLLHDNPEIGISYRKVTISTCGLIPGIERLMVEGAPINLSISLHASNDRVRSALMPINKKYNINKLIEASRLYTKATGRRVTFEYAMISGVNDSEAFASELAAKLAGMLCHVNLIPVNAIEGSPYKPSDRTTIDRFENRLRRSGVNVTVRRALGGDVSGACGQLRSSGLADDEKMI